MNTWKLSSIKRTTIDGVEADFRMIETESPMIAGQGVALVHVKDRNEANACLIAAAPELLAATKRMIDWLEGVSDEIDIIDMALQARAAIAKATDDTETARAAYFDAGQPF